MMTAKSHHKGLVYFYLMVQNLHHINQRKEHRYTPSMRDDKDDEDDKDDSKVSHDRMHKNCVALNKEKDVGLIQASSADEDDKDDEYDSGFFYLSFPSRDAQNLRRIKQRKGLYLIHE